MKIVFTYKNWIPHNDPELIDTLLRFKDTREVNNFILYPERITEHDLVHLYGEMEISAYAPNAVHKTELLAHNLTQIGCAVTIQWAETRGEVDNFRQYYYLNEPPEPEPHPNANADRFSELRRQIRRGEMVFIDDGGSFRFEALDPAVWDDGPLSIGIAKEPNEDEPKLPDVSDKFHF